MIRKVFKKQPVIHPMRQLSDEELLHKLNEKLLQSMTTDRAAKYENVITLINVLEKKLKVAFILPQMLENYKHLEVCLTGTKYEIVIKLIRAFLKEYTEESADLYSGRIVMHNLIDYVIENYELVKYLPKWLNELDHNDKEFVKYMDELKAIAKNHFARTALNKIHREEELNNLHERNEQVLSDITYLEEKLKQKGVSFTWRSVARAAVIMKMQEEIKAYENDIRMKAHQFLSTLKREYVKNPAGHINRRKVLEEDFQKSKQGFFKYKFNNMNLEKAATDEKNKLVLQLQTLKRKYDEVMLQKYRENMELDEQLKEAKQQLNELMPIYDREEAIYYELVVKPAEEKEREHQLLVLQFTQNRAAKVIQRWYRKKFREMRQVAAKAKAKAEATKKKKSNKKK